MIKRICILTKSYKNGGYCVAGIDIDNKKFVRLVNSDDPTNDEIKKEQMFLDEKSIECLDVVEFDFIKNIPNSCQTENWLLNKTNKPKFIKSFTLEVLIDLLKFDNDNYFILNNGSALSAVEIAKLNRSLFVYYVQNLKIDATTYESFGEIRFRYKCSFEYNNKIYTNISLTDPAYRDMSQDGMILENALIVASLPCVPYNDNLYYKFVAKIFPIEDQTAFYIDNYKEENSLTNKISPFNKHDLTIHAKQTPGVVLLENYEQIKQNISNGVAYYSQFEYSLENYQLALKHHNELKHVKNILERTKREIIKNYNSPLAIVEKKLDELINLVKIPFKRIDAFIKQNEKESKKYQILSYANKIAISNGLQEHLNHILKSPAFFDSKWLNSSCTKSTWQYAVSSKLHAIAIDIKQILSMKNDNLASLLANYYQTLSMKSVEEFLDSLKTITIIAQNIKLNDKDTSIKTTQSQTNITKADKEVIDFTKTKSLNIEKLREFEILNYIANSINPFTGEILTGIDKVLKAKLIAIASKLEDMSKTDNVQEISAKKVIRKTDKNQQNEIFNMVGEKWTEQEDANLILEFNRALSIPEIANIHKRKYGGIRARLKKHKLIE